MSKINNTFIGNAEDLDIVVSMYNLLEYSGNYSMTLVRLWNYYRDEVNDFKTKIILTTPDNNNNTLYTEAVVPLKYLNIFEDLLI